jgi:hypothetical protein
MFLRFITRGDHRTIVLVTAYRDAEGKPRQKTQSLGSYRHQGHDLAGNWLGPWKPVDEWIQEHNAHALANQRSPEQIASRITAMVEVDNAHRHRKGKPPLSPEEVETVTANLTAILGPKLITRETSGPYLPKIFPVEIQPMHRKRYRRAYDAVQKIWGNALKLLPPALLAQLKEELPWGPEENNLELLDIYGEVWLGQAS